MKYNTKGGCTPGAKLRYAREARDAKLSAFQSPLCIFNMSVHTGCKATPAMLATSRAWFDWSPGRRFLENTALFTHAHASTFGIPRPPTPTPTLMIYKNIVDN